MGGATRCNQRRIRAYFLVKRTIAKRFTLTLPWFSYGQNAPTKPIRTKLAIDPIRLPDRSFWQPYFFPAGQSSNNPPRLTGSAVRKKRPAEESSSAGLANSVGCPPYIRPETSMPNSPRTAFQPSRKPMHDLHGLPFLKWPRCPPCPRP